MFEFRQLVTNLLDSCRTNHVFTVGFDYVQGLAVYDVVASSFRRQVVTYVQEIRYLFSDVLMGDREVEHVSLQAESSLFER